MAHELFKSKITGKYEMAYTGEVPWHGLGQQVTPGAPLEVWQREAGLNWTAKEATVQYHNEDGLLLPMNSRKVIYRSDDCHPLGDVSSKYQIVQPRELLETTRDLVTEGGWEIETAGTIRHGARIWVMAKSAEAALTTLIGKYDRVNARLLLVTSMDGSLRTMGKLVSTRVVCANTLAVALTEDGEEVSMRHNQYFDPDGIKESLGVAVESFKEFVEQIKEMAERPIKLDDAREVLRGLFGQPSLKDIKPTQDDYGFQKLMAQFTKTDGQKQQERRSVTRVLELFAGEGLGSQLPNSQGTQWGLLNAVTQHVDHEMGRTVDTRMDSAWFGRGADIKEAAFFALSEMAEFN